MLYIFIGFEWHSKNNKKNLTETPLDSLLLW